MSDGSMEVPVSEPAARPSAGVQPAGAGPRQEATGRAAGAARDTDVVMRTEDVTVTYDGIPALRDITIDIHRNRITAFIGASGCGKSTLLRCFNRMNDLIPTAEVRGSVLYHGEDLYQPGVDPVEVRRHIGMVFQKPNPFPKSIYDNVAFGPKVLHMKVDMDEVVERSLRQAALWDEAKDRLKDNALGLSGGQQQRLCIARALATSPDVLLMDEPCSALDPIATGRIEDLMVALREQYTIVIVTHNMQQATRVSDMTAFITVELDEHDNRTGTIIEYEETGRLFSQPADPRTEEYVTGRIG